MDTSHEDTRAFLRISRAQRAKQPSEKLLEQTRFLTNTHFQYVLCFSNKSSQSDTMCALPNLCTQQSTVVSWTNPTVIDICYSLTFPPDLSGCTWVRKYMSLYSTINSCLLNKSDGNRYLLLSYLPTWPSGCTWVHKYMSLYYNLPWSLSTFLHHKEHLQEKRASTVRVNIRNYVE
jgi:hypothetical protein